VEDDLADLRYLSEEAVQEREAVVASQQALDLEMERYRAGTDSYLNVITTQTIALGDQQTAITILQRQMTAAVDLVKALGGGWDASTLPSGNLLRTVALGDPKSTQNVAQPVVK
jgi:outer membrane protein TolC